MNSLSIDLLLPDFFWKSLVEVICGHHLAVRIDVSEHDLLGLSDGILIVEDKERVCLHVNALYTIFEDLKSIVKVYHAKFCNQLVVCLSQLNRKA